MSADNETSEAREFIDWRTVRWPMWADGMLSCPCCGAHVHPSMRDLHAHMCYAVKVAMGEIIDMEAGR